VVSNLAEASAEASAEFEVMTTEADTEVSASVLAECFGQPNIFGTSLVLTTSGAVCSLARCAMSNMLL
jgi:hypothetical protein